MRVIIGIATTAERRGYAEKSIASLEANNIKPDEIHLYNNNIGEDLTDNGKFHQLQHIKEPVYFFSCDDDIIYPTNYIASMITDIENHKCIISHHGRRLVNLDADYYSSHYRFSCLNDNPNRCSLDVAGTGVSAWRTDYFNPIDICYSEHKKMADCVFSLEAARQGKKIMLTPHSKGWLKDLKVPKELTIYETEKNNTSEQTKICNQIIKLNHSK